MNKFHSLVNLSKILMLTAFTLFASQTLAHRSSIDRIVAFGASLTDSGNSYYWLTQPGNQGCGKINVPPTFNLDDFLVPDGPYFFGGQYHFSNGPTWVEGFARYLALAPSAQPAFSNGDKKLTNYAVGGARAVADFPCRVNLPEQVQTYFADYTRTSPRTLIALEIGGNDVRDALLSGAADPTPYIESAIASIAQNLTALYMHGARNFLVMNVPDLGKTPAVRMIPGASQGASLLTQVFNQNLMTVLKTINRLPGAKVRLLDVKGKLDEVIKHAGDYGFANVTDACVKPNQIQEPYQCAVPDSYLFWDGIHPTEAMHEIVAQQAISVMGRR